MAEEANGAAQALVLNFLSTYPTEAAGVLNSISVAEVIRVLDQTPVSDAVEVFVGLNPEVATQAIEQMSDEGFVRLFSVIDPSRGANLLARLDDRDFVAARLALLPAAVSRELQELIAYPPDTAGALMDARVMVFRPEDTVETVLDRLPHFRQRRILDICVADADGKLVGVIPLQEVAIGELDERLETLFQGAPVGIQAMAPREDVVDLLEKQKLSSIPVVDLEGRLLGIIRHDVLVSAAQHDASESLQAMVGAGREERALSKVSFAVRKRLLWLEINLGTAFLAAAVVGLFEGTIAKFTLLAVLLPVVAGQSGNTGAQALAVTMRGLTLREFRVREWFRVVRKEVAVGFFNGVAIGLTTAFFVYIFMGPGYALVIGISMVFSMICASLAGAAIPIVLTSLRQDPAQSASIILTTVTDVMGFLSFLGIATMLAHLLALE